MSTDSVDDLHAAEDRLLSRMSTAESETYCRPTCGWLDSDPPECESGAERPDDEDLCGCPCGHRTPGARRVEPETTTVDYEQRRSALLSVPHGMLDAGCEPPFEDGDRPSRFALVEHNRHTGEWYLTTHDAPADAAEYWSTQEDHAWEPIRLFDLDGGARFDPQVSLVWIPTPPDSEPEPQPEKRTP